MGTKQFSTTVRELTTHKVNGLNDAIRILVLDRPGQGNACHEYAVCVPTPLASTVGGEIIREAQETDNTVGEETIPQMAFGFRFEGRDGSPDRVIYVPQHQILMIEEWVPGQPGSRKTYYEVQAISFQNGPIKEVGFTGNTQEALLAVLIDRLEGFQAGPYKCHDNQLALDAIQTARLFLHKRTLDRLGRGVEGTHAK